jgi:hypothetical protein
MHASQPFTFNVNGFFSGSESPQGALASSSRTLPKYRYRRVFDLFSFGTDVPHEKSSIARCVKVGGRVRTTYAAQLISFGFKSILDFLGVPSPNG